MIKNRSKTTLLIIGIFIISALIGSLLLSANKQEEALPQPQPQPAPQPQPREEYLILNGDQFNQLFNQADLVNLASIEGVEPPEITGDQTRDEEIREIAIQRGYRHRPEVLDRNQLIPIEGEQHFLQPQAAEAYLQLKEAAAEAGHQIHISSAFRDYDLQRQIFLNNVGDPNQDEDVEQILKERSIPGYSKHHSGYTIDIGEGDFNFETFIDSESYAWLAADNYLNAKKHGWIPSYPPDATNQGPDPEPWEFVYVGRERLLNP